MYVISEIIKIIKFVMLLIDILRYLSSMIYEMYVNIIFRDRS